MAVEKGLFQAPKGVEEEETEQLEIEIKKLFIAEVLFVNASRTGVCKT